jgi:hypothetical protein
VCVLCGQLISEVHWTERRFDAGDVGGAGGEVGRRRDRFHRSRIVRRVLDHYGLDFADEWSATSYVVSNRKGASELVRHLGEVWPAAERLGGRRPDPLDPALLERLEEGPSA